MTIRLAILAALAALASLAAADSAPAPRFSFAVLADIQYADRGSANSRDYRGSLGKLAAAAAAIDAERPAFVVQLGDLVDDGAESSVRRVLPLLDGIRAPKHQVPGNHDLRRPGGGHSWYDFRRGGWRFVILDGMDLNIANPAGARMLAALRQAGRKNAMDWNGGIGEQQKSWLRDVLASAARKREPVVIFCHFPVVEEASSAAHLLWNHEEIAAIVEQSGAVAWFNGHDHRGGYARRSGVHYVTFPGMVESGEAGSWTMVRVHDDYMELRGSGTAPHRVLR
ncbi:MAG TPA: metallophosphoesterase [Bryobacteraceae bacterium]|nr:metallophosphoesterase [Bryobacteraceae bacterium]